MLAPSPRAWRAALLLIALAWSPTLGHQFVDFDDGTIFLDNPLLMRHDAAAALDILSPARPDWRPLRDLSHWADFLVHGQRPLWAHLHNLLLLVGVAALCGLLLRRVGRGGPWALALAFLHPVLAESVAWVSGRKELLAGLCFFGFLLAFLRFVDGRRRRWALACLALLVLGVMAKGHVLVAPLVAALLLWHEHLRRGLPLRPGASLVLASALTSLALIPLVARGGVLLHAGLDHDLRYSLVLGDRLQIPLRYAGELLWPADLSPIYLSPRLDGWHLPLSVLGVAFVLLYLGLCAWRLRRRDPRGAWALIPAALLLPYLHLRPGSVYMADRYLFLVVPFVVALVAEGAAALPLRARPRRLLGAGVLLISLAALLPQAMSWRDSTALWLRMTAVYPDNARGFDRLGQALFRAGDYAAAAGAFVSAGERDPGDPRHAQHAGAAFAAQGRPDVAALYFEEAAAALRRGSAASPSGTAPAPPPR